MRLSDEEVKQIYGRAKIPQEYVDVGLKKGVREEQTDFCFTLSTGCFNPLKSLVWLT